METLSRTKNILLPILIGIVFIACENNVEEDTTSPDGGSNGNEPCDTNISFTTSVKPIIDANCIACHNGNQFPDLRTYQGIFDNAQNVRSQVVSRRMPLNGSLTNEEIELIRCWIENGALNN
ncbi:cytochrome c [Aquimarina gracilis]|uniref:Cytochrome c n=1 Tax=Aquimarina gracilis TaxID=874422 RepID=A0ABU5ZXB7_9FLAO|nr:cytochrome c [Aquimarina gracilis]MEB3346477.1 cytochrome c [Aquimarina gracilis]